MNAEKTALLMIGFQNDYFAEDGILHGVVEESSRITGTLANTMDLLEHLRPSPVLLVSTPIIFTEDYSELNQPVGILQHIKEVGAFKAGTRGSETISELKSLGERLIEAALMSVENDQRYLGISGAELEFMLQCHRYVESVLAEPTAQQIPLVAEIG